MLFRSLLVVSAHAPHAAGEGDERVRRILRKRRTYEVLRQFIGGRGPVVLGIDANAWIDPEPDELGVFGGPLVPLAERDRPDPSIDQSDIGQFLDNGFVDGEYEPDEPRDALRRWLKGNPDRRAEVLARRPYGPWAVTYNRSANYARPDRRDIVMVSSEIEVRNVEHDYEDSLAAGSDHSYVLCDLEV